MPPRYDFARRMAQKYLRQYRITAPPVPVEYFLFEEGVRVEVLDYPDATAGESWWEGEVAHIAVSRALPQGRLRFTLAHEWGHLVLRHHNQQAGDLSFLYRRLRDTEDTPLHPSDPIEVEANTFAGELLLPHGLFLRDWEARPDVRSIARRYEVSETAVRLRLRGLGRDTHHGDTETRREKKGST